MKYIIMIMSLLFFSSSNILYANDGSPEGLIIFDALKVVKIRNAYTITFTDEDGKEFIGLMPQEGFERSGMSDWPEDGSRTINIAWSEEKGAGLVIPETGLFYKAHIPIKNAIYALSFQCGNQTNTHLDVAMCYKTDVGRWQKEYDYYYNELVSYLPDAFKEKLVIANRASRDAIVKWQELYDMAAIEYTGTMRAVRALSFQSARESQRLWTLLSLYRIIPDQSEIEVYGLPE